MRIKYSIKNMYSVIIAGIIVLVLIIFLPYENKYTHVNSLESNLGELGEGTVVEQTFIANEDNLSSIGIMFGKYLERPNINITINLSENGQIIVNRSINTRQLKDGKFSYVNFEGIGDSKGKEYRISIIFDEVDGQKITIYNSHNDVYNYGKCFQNGEEKEFDISFFTSYKLTKRDALKKIGENLNSGYKKVIFIIILFIITLISVLREFYFYRKE